MPQYYNEKRLRDYRDLINNSANLYPKRIAFKLKISEGKYREITYTQLRDYYYRFCAYLLKNGFGGKRIAVSGSNCFEWVLSYLGAATVGVAVPIDKELGADDVNDFLDSSYSSVICTDSSRISALKPVVKRKMEYIDFADLESICKSMSGADYSVVDTLPIDPKAMSILIFTSGTTGNSKGVCLSQSNVCANIHSTLKMVKIKPDDSVLSILPLHHTYECTLDCLLVLSKGCCISYCEGVTKVAKNLTEYSPTALVVVPALLKVLNKRIKAAIIKDCPEKYRSNFENYSLSEALEKTPFLIRKVICGKVMKSLGGKIRLFIVGAADLDCTLVEDFMALGIRTLQGYGLTECSPLLAANNDFHFNPRSTGVAIPDVELKIENPNDEGVGEIIAKGENIMLGYYNDEESTAAVLKDGWFHTGDLGKFDENGDLFIKGRIKNVIVTENGKNIYPEELETRLSKFPEISEVLVYGFEDNGTTNVKAKIFPNIDYLKEKFGRHPNDDEVRSAIQDTVKSVNKKIPKYKNIKAFEVLSAALEKTTTQKIKRFGQNTK
ncbi:MAG: AMP-binding protein [Clostridia bacterium]|nr:AMP-binding protein [Clostridia bacterium]